MQKDQISNWRKTAQLVKNFSAFLETKKRSPNELIQQHGDSIREKLTQASTSDQTVLICAFNEEASLPYLLHSIAKNQPSLRVVVVDNNSSDRTSKIAEELGACVIKEERPGLIHALICGYNFLATQTEQPRFIFHTDADSYVQPSWAESMIRFADKHITPESGGQIFAPLIFYGSLSRDSFRTAISLSLDLYFHQQNASRPHGPNGLIVPTLDKSMLKHIAQPVEEEIVTGTDDFIHQRVLQAKGQHAFNFSPSSVVFTSGDRYTSIRQILKTFLSPNMSKSVYQEWHDRQPHGYRYVSPKRPKIGKY